MKHIKLFEQNSEEDLYSKYPNLFNLFVDHSFIDKEDYEEVDSVLKKLNKNEIDVTTPYYYSFKTYISNTIHNSVLDIHDDFEDEIKEFDSDTYNDFMMKCLKYKPDLFVLACLSAENVKKAVNYKPDLLNSDRIEDIVVLIQHKFLPLVKNFERLPYKDKVLYNGELHVSVSSLETLSYLIKDDQQDMFKSHISGEFDYFRDYASSFGDFKTYHIDDINDNTLQEILEKCEEEIDLEDEEIISFFEENDISIDNWKKEIDLSNLGDFLDIDLFEDIRGNIVNAFDEAQSIADSNEAYNACYDNLADFFGVSKFEHDGTNYLIPFSLKWLEPFCVVNDIADAYNLANLESSLEYLFDNWEEMPKYSLQDEEYEKLEINEPYYGWNGDIDSDTLNECISNRLGW
jgi:hypothetical protein